MLHKPLLAITVVLENKQYTLKVPGVFLTSTKRNISTGASDLFGIVDTRPRPTVMEIQLFLWVSADPFKTASPWRHPRGHPRGHTVPQRAFVRDILVIPECLPMHTVLMD